MRLKKTGLVLFLVLLLLALAGWWLYANRQKLYPKVEEVNYLKVDLESDTAFVKAGLQVQNFLPLNIRIDSVDYQIRNNGTRLAWGAQLVSETLPALGDKVLDFGLHVKTQQYRQHLKQLEKTHDSLDLEVDMRVFFNLPFFNQKSIAINRQITTAIPKAPGLRLDSVMVKSFSPEEGYSLVLQLTGLNTSLPNLRLENFRYRLRFKNLPEISGVIDTVFQLSKTGAQVQVPLQIETSEAIALLKKQLTGSTNWHYAANLSATVRSSHPLFEEVEVAVEKAGSFSIGNLAGNGSRYMPTVARVKRLQLESDEQITYVAADLVVHNPAPVPFYIDSATYYLSYRGKPIASGKKDFEKVLPKQGNRELKLTFTVQEKALNQLLQEAQNQTKVPLDISLNLLYNLPDAGRQKIAIRKTVQVPLPGGSGLQVAGLEVLELNPEAGAHLLLKLQTAPDAPDVLVKQLDYELDLGEGLLIKGRSPRPVRLGNGQSSATIPVWLSGHDLNQLVRRLLQQNQLMPYRLSGTAVVTAIGTPFRNTRISVLGQGELSLPITGGQGSNRLMPHVAAIDSMRVTILPDTAWINLKLTARNPLPATITITNLQLRLLHQPDTIGIIAKDLNKLLPAEGKAQEWVTLALNYQTWQSLLRQNQQQDSLQLTQQIVLGFKLGQLPAQEVPFTRQTKIGTPRIPVIRLQKAKIQGIGLRQGIKLKGLVEVQNQNVKGLKVSNVYYDIVLQKNIEFCGTINRTYDIPLGQSVVEFPFSVSVGEALRLVGKKLFGSKEWQYQIHATAQVKTASPVLQQVFTELNSTGKSVMSKKSAGAP